MPECAFHRGVETNVRCVECERPICPKDFVTTPVGYKCPDCAKQLPSARRVVKPRQLLIAAAAALGSGIAGALVMSALRFGWLLVAILLGMIVGEITRRASGGHRQLPVAGIAAVGMLVGGFVGDLGLLSTGLATTAAFVTVAANRW